jgi:hypothetical protein
MENKVPDPVAQEFKNTFYPQLHEWVNGWQPERVQRAWSVYRNLPPSARKLFQLQVDTVHKVAKIKQLYKIIGGVGTAEHIESGKEIKAARYYVTWDKISYRSKKMKEYLMVLTTCFECAEMFVKHMETKPTEKDISDFDHQFGYACGKVTIMELNKSGVYVKVQE